MLSKRGSDEPAERHIAAAKGLVDAVVLIHDPSAKADVTESLRKNFRFAKAEDAEASYRVLALMATVEIMPDPVAWKSSRKSLHGLTSKLVKWI